MVKKMAEYIACRSCDSPDCKGCNLKRLETMLKNGKFECLMNENRGINTLADVAPVRHGRWIEKQEKDTFAGYLYSYECSECGRVKQRKEPYCPNCGAKMGDKLYG